MTIGKVFHLYAVLLALFLLYACGDEGSGSDSNGPEVPTITLVGSSKIIVKVDEVYVDPGATAIDDLDGDLTSEIMVEGSVDTSSVGIYTITYNVTDSSGNSANQVVRTVIVEPLFPLISDISVSTAGISHGENVTITASIEGFGSKGTSQVAPILWDDASGADYLDLWDGGWPESGSQPSSTPRYAASGSIGGVSVAHGNVSSYLAMRAYDEGGGGGFPQNNMVWHRLPSGNIPSYMYMSWYSRVHPSYDSGDNFKWFDYSGGTSPYDSTGNWYLENVGGLSGSLHSNDNGAGLYSQVCDGSSFRDFLCNSKFHGSSGPITSQWVKYELKLYITDQNDGWFDLYEDGVLEVNQSTVGTGTRSYNGPTDSTISSSVRNIGIGGFNRNRRVNNWRFYNDIYIDYTLAHIIIGNSPLYSASTIKEVQLPQSWTNESITFKVNQGVLVDGDRAYLFVIKADGEPSVGYGITIGPPP